MEPIDLNMKLMLDLYTLYTWDISGYMLGRDLLETVSSREDLDLASCSLPSFGPPELTRHVPLV